MNEKGADDRIATNLLTGFLGSGKTSLLRRLLALPDHLLLERIDEDIVLLESGCPLWARLNLESGTPLRRQGTPDDVVGAVRSFASEPARSITGQSIVVDIGYAAK